jgi:segregation and condensation protein B
MKNITQYIEALLFVAQSPLSISTIRSILEETFGNPLEEIILYNSLISLKKRYEQDEFAFEIVEIAGGFQFLTKTTFHAVIATHLKQITKKRLSQAALETLSIIAYKQPIAKNQIEQIRGVNCDYALQKLLEKELIAISGRTEAVGRALLYTTSEKFMDYFGIKSLQDLPKLKDFKEIENSIGEEKET